MPVEIDVGEIWEWKGDGDEGVYIVEILQAPPDRWRFQIRPLEAEQQIYTHIGIPVRWVGHRGFIRRRRDLEKEKSDDGKSDL